MVSHESDAGLRYVLNRLPASVQVCFFSATLVENSVSLAEHIEELVQRHMRDPARILVKRDELTLEGIKQVSTRSEAQSAT